MPSFKPTQSAYTWEQKKNIKYNNLKLKKKKITNRKKKQKLKLKNQLQSKKCNLRHTYVCHVR